MYTYVCVCVCVCEIERERASESSSSNIAAMGCFHPPKSSSYCRPRSRKASPPIFGPVHPALIECEVSPYFLGK